MRIALVTNELPHHKFWIYKLHQKFDVRLIIHPQNKNKIENIKSKRLLRYGIFYFILKLLSILFNLLNKNSMRLRLKNAEAVFFSDFVDKYNQIPNKIKYKVNSINNDYSVNLIKKNEIDVICFLGGDIAKSRFINSANMISLNYHSGISPFYNGSKTVFHSVSDFLPNFCGGTMMIINEKIDGGRILSHYLTPIDKNDTAASLFMKGIIGSVKLYCLILNEIALNKIPKGIEQKLSHKYVTYLDWNISNDIRLHYFENSKLMTNHSRREKIINYSNYKGKTNNFDVVLNEILGKKVEHL